MPSKADLNVLVLAFKWNCDRYRIRYRATKDREGKKHLILTTDSPEMKTACHCLSIVLEQKPELEAQLIQEAERRAANLAGRSRKKQARTD